MNAQPVASLSLDLDNKWAYLRAAGRGDWESAPSYLPLAVERIVDLLGEIGLPLTVFLVGRDCQSGADGDAIRRFGELRKWEAANHTWNHLPWMHAMSQGEVTNEIHRTHDAIGSLTGQTAVGFRGPGFSCPPSVLRVLADAGYCYDASVFATSMAPIARAVFLARTDLQGEQREKAKQLYGGFASMRQPNIPHRRVVDGDGSNQVLGEVPVTVMPWTRTPIHFSYLTFLAGYSIAAAKTYFRAALKLCRWSKVPPSLLLHPPDFLGQEDDADMAYFPGMRLSRASKLAFMRWALRTFHEQFDVQTISDQLRLCRVRDGHPAHDHSVLQPVTSVLHA
ncbi:MAG: polysaccharide deacetylase family protein [Planctomycetota bacterium]